MSFPADRQSFSSLEDLYGGLEVAVSVTLIRASRSSDALQCSITAIASRQWSVCDVYGLLRGLIARMSVCLVCLDSFPAAAVTSATVSACH